MEESISGKVLEVLKNVGNVGGGSGLEHVENVIVGSNAVPLARMLEFGHKNGFSTMIVSEKLDGEAAHFSGRFIDGKFYIITGSKNVHMLISCEEDIEKYEGLRYV